MSCASILHLTWSSSSHVRGAGCRHTGTRLCNAEHITCR